MLQVVTCCFSRQVYNSFYNLCHSLRLTNYEVNSLAVTYVKTFKIYNEVEGQKVVRRC